MIGEIERGKKAGLGLAFKVQLRTFSGKRLLCFFVFFSSVGDGATIIINIIHS